MLCACLNEDGAQFRAEFERMIPPLSINSAALTSLCLVLYSRLMQRKRHDDMMMTMFNY